MVARRPDREVVLPVQRLRIRYTKTGRMRFSSHRDFQRALERALRRVDVPMAYSAGFSTHPRISYANAAPTGAASLAEFVEIGVVARCDPRALAERLDQALPTGLDIAEVVEARTPDLVARLEASRWEVLLRGCDRDTVTTAWQALWDASEVEVARMTKSGLRTFDVRSALVEGGVLPSDPEAPADLVGLRITLRHQVPAVRPDDVVAALGVVAGLRPSEPAILTRQTQGPLAADGSIGDPLAPDREAA